MLSRYCTYCTCACLVKHMMLVLRLDKTSLKHKMTPRSKQHIISRHGSVQKNRKKLLSPKDQRQSFQAQQAL